VRTSVSQSELCCKLQCHASTYAVPMHATTVLYLQFWIDVNRYKLNKRWLHENSHRSLHKISMFIHFSKHYNFIKSHTLPDNLIFFLTESHVSHALSSTTAVLLSVMRFWHVHSQSAYLLCCSSPSASAGMCWQTTMRLRTVVARSVAKKE
jgi:hypothetical protein